MFNNELTGLVSKYELEITISFCLFANREKHMQKRKYYNKKNVEVTIPKNVLDVFRINFPKLQFDELVMKKDQNLNF